MRHKKVKLKNLSKVKSTLFEQRERKVEVYLLASWLKFNKMQIKIIFGIFETN